MKWFGPLLIAFFLFLALFPYQAQAQEEISAYSTVEIDYPSALTLNLVAESSANITEIILRYRVDKITTVKVTSLIDLEFEQAPVVETSWKWDMRKSSLPPGAEVQYSWQIEDINGNVLETAWDVVKFNDDRYSWDSLVGEKVTLFWYRGGQAFSRELMDEARESLERLARDTGAYLEYPVKIYVYAGSTELKEALVYPQEWVGGVTFTEYGAVAIGIAPEDLAWGKRAMTHELAHLVTYQMTFNPYSDIPIWLSEGLSMYAEGDLEASFRSSFDNAVSDDGLVSVQTLSSNFPADPREAYLSYAESFRLVEFLIDNYGREEMLHLLSVFKQGSRYDDALEEVYGFDTVGLDNRWRASLGLEPRSVPSPSATEEIATPTPTSGDEFFGCQTTSAETKHGSVAVFGTLGLLLLPGIGEAVRLRVRRGSKK